MAAGKLTKTELRREQLRLTQLRRYLPTLQLKKALLQVEVDSAQAEIEEALVALREEEAAVERFTPLLNDPDAFALADEIEVKTVVVDMENIAGIDVPIFVDVVFGTSTTLRWALPIWFEAASDRLRHLIRAREKVRCLRRKKEALEKELREVAIRVNLFEKVMIPRALEQIKKIKIFLGDQQLAAVAQAKVSKRKILLREELE